MRRQKGFTLIELLIVVAIIGIIAAIAIPNLLNAINRGRQKRTMADIRSIATSIEAYSVDNNFYPRPAAGAITQLVTWIEPTYMRKMPPRDGWGNSIYWDGDTGSGQSYTIWSSTRNNNPAMALIGTGGTTTSFDNDIIYSLGSFVQWPEGIQTGV